MHHYEQPPQQEPPPEKRAPSGMYRVAVPLPVSPPRLTYALLGMIVLIFMYYMSLSVLNQNLFLYDWAKVNDLIKDGEYYRLFTSMFLHLNLMHIFFNGYALYVIGRDVEALFGTARFALVYFLGGLSGSLASFVFSDAPSVGASGAIFAIFGAEMVYFYLHRDLHGEAGRRHLNQLMVIMLINLGLGFFSTTGATDFRIDNASHIGGLFGGVVLAWFISPNYNVERDVSAPSGMRVVDRNPMQHWALPSVLYAVGLVAITAYAIAA